jgi:hypothetical protein
MMKKHIFVAFISVMVMLFLISCEGKKIMPVDGWETYTDQITKFSVKYPKNWVVQRFPGERFIIYTTQNAIKRFKTFEAEGEPAVRMDFISVKLEGDKTFDSVVAKKFFQDTIYSKPQNVKIAGVDGIKQKYQFPLGDGLFQGEIYYATKDNKIVNVLIFEAFGETFESYKNVFDEVLASVKLAEIPEVKQDTIKQVIELPPPSQNLVKQQGEGFSIMVPDNFDIKFPRIPRAIKSFQYIGERRADCDIRVDIIDASKQNDLNKIAEQMKPNHGNANPSQSTLAGQKAMVFNYSPIRGVNSRVYYVVKGERLFRVTMNWFTGEEKDYKPIFEKSVNSIKFQ